MKQVVIGWGGEIELLSWRAVVTRAVKSQSPFKVQELAHEVKVRGDVGLFPFHKVVGVIQGQVELLHQVGHSYRDRPADACKAVNKNTTLLGTSLI